MEDMVVGGDGNNDAEVRSFEQAKSILYGTISKAGAALESASRRRKSTVEAMRGYLDRLQLDVSGLSVIHVTGTKGKGSTCALVESVLRRHGFKTGLFTSPHLLEVTERVRVCGKPISKERFARYLFQVWDRLQATRRAEAVTSAGGGAEGSMAAADMPTYFHLLTLIGLWCFVQAQVDVCVVEVGMGGRYDATNVVPTPVACGVAMLDLDHTQVLGDTLDKIALEKGGIFKEHSQAFAVEQPRGGMSVLRQCAEDVGCTLEVVEPLPTHDPAGVVYEIGLGGDHQRVNAGLALRLCAAWLKARRQPRQSSSAAAPARENTVVGGQNSCGDAEEGFIFLRSEAVHRGLAECAWPGRCQIYRPPSLPLVTVYLDGAHTEQSMHACLQWFVGKTAATERAAAVSHPDPATDDTADVEEKQLPEVQQPRRGGGNRSTRCRRVLWFNASHERDVVPLLDMLASARARTLGQRSESYSDDNNNSDSNSDSDSDSSPDGLAEGDDAPLFDSAWFMEVPPARPSRVTPPTAQEILAPHGMFTVDQDKAKGLGAAASGGTYASARGEGESGDSVPGAPEAGAGDWQRTLQQVWVALQTRHAGKLSVTQTGSAPDLYANMLSMRRTEEGRGDGAGVVVDRHSVALSGAIRISVDPLDPLAGVGVREKGGQGNEQRRETTGVGMSSGDERIDVLCTGSLYAVAAALEAFGAEVV